MKPHTLDGSVVVITGASSGIGRAAAHAFARRGARLVLAARREAELAETARECERYGARSALTVPTDVSDARAVERLANAAVAQYGHLDVWVNNAGVLLLARVEDAPLAAFERVMQVNFFGYLHGARAALRHFRRQGTGVLINNASILGFTGWPYGSAYVSSKFAVRGLSECLREELRGAPRIHVCTVMPATIDTPVFQRAANYTSWRPRAVPPVYAPQRVARAMVRVAQRPRAEVVVGEFGKLVHIGRTFAPRLIERFIARFGPGLQFAASAPRDEAFPRDGNLFEPAQDAWKVTGGWRAPRSRLLLTGAAVGVLVALIGVARSGRRVKHR